MNTEIFHVRVRALASLIPPPRLQLSQWIEREIVLPEGVSTLPGAVRLWPYQREIADAIKDLACEQVTLLKPTRVGEAPRLRLAARAAWPWRLRGRRPCVGIGWSSFLVTSAGNHAGWRHKRPCPSGHCGHQADIIWWP
jgi:hypothetical protein